MASHVLTSVAVAAAACVAVSGPAAAAEDGEQVVTIRVRALPSIGGFGDIDAARAPLSTSSIGSEAIVDRGARSLADLLRLDPATSDAYNAEGYWSALTVRGFVLDPRSNVRRDGLPISGETWIPLVNKDRVELLKGTSGVQAGISSPGGLVNYVVKRPNDERSHAHLEWREPGSFAVGADVSRRLGSDGRFGLRVNAQIERLRPQAHQADGESALLAIAGDWRLTPDLSIEAEGEWSRHSQPSVPGFSLLGPLLPDAAQIDPRTNINNQPWSQPVEFTGSTASLRLRQRLASDWALVAHGAVQRLSTDDRIAFPYGCTDPGGTYYADRYCPDGSLDLYDYRSDNEERKVTAFDLHAEGSLNTGPVSHQATVGLLMSVARDRFNRQAFNYAGTGTIRADTVVPESPALTGENTNRDERSLELYLRDRAQLAPQWALWGGLRATYLRRESVRTDGSEATNYSQDFLTPWLALSFQWDEATLLYASWGEGVESEVVPNRSRYVNRGQALPALESRQFEAGVKHDSRQLAWSVIGFDIERPLGTDECDGATPPLCTRTLGEPARHRGVEAQLALRVAPFTAQAGVQALQARQAGERPANVAERSARLQLEHGSEVAGGRLGLWAAAAYEGPRLVVPGETTEALGWTRWDLGARWQGRWGSVPTTLRLGLDNATDKRAWRETPYQFGHAYLFPLPPRSWRASLDVAL